MSLTIMNRCESGFGPRDMAAYVENPANFGNSPRLQGCLANRINLVYIAQLILVGSNRRKM